MDLSAGANAPELTALFILSEMAMPELYEVVRVLQDLPDLHLRAGDAGTVVMVFSEPTPAFEVEFVDDEVRTLATHALLPEQIEAAEPG